jgi:GT2 family glycosyltransferase
VDLVETPVVLFLDDDVTLPPDYVATLLERWERTGFETLGGIIGSPTTYPRHRRLSLLLRRAFMLHYVDASRRATTLRRSRKLRYVPRPLNDVEVPAVGAGGALFRTELARRHPFDEHFPGYALGEDLEMSFRLASEAPILQTSAVEFHHEWDPRERESPLRWHYRGRCEAYFRLRHLGRSPLDVAAFGLSVAAETALALADTIRERNSDHLHQYVKGLLKTLREVRRAKNPRHEKAG